MVPGSTASCASGRTSPWFALALAPALQPWVLIGAGAATVVEAKLSSWESFLALLGYCVLGDRKSVV